MRSPALALTLFVATLPLGCESDAPAPAEAETAADERVAAAPLELPHELELRVDEYIGQWGQHWPSFRFHGVIGIGIAQDVRWQRAYGYRDLAGETENDAHSRFQIGTMSSHLAIATAHVLAEEGVWSLDDPVTKWVPGLGLPRSLTLEQLMTYSSGLPSFTQTLQFEVAKRKPATNLQIVSGFAHEPLEFAPGDDFAPSNSNAVALALAIEQATDATFKDVVAQKVLQPLGMTQTAYGPADDARATGMVFNEAEFLVPVTGVDPLAFGAAGAWSSTAEDQLRLYAAFTSGFFGDGAKLERILGANKIELPHGFVEATSHGRRSFLWIGLIDGFSSAVLLFPEDELSIVVLGNAEVVPAADIAQAVADIAYGAEPAERVEARETPVAASELAKLAGEWRMTTRSHNEIVQLVEPETFDAMVRARVEWSEGRGLALSLGKLGAKRMHASDPHRFFFKDRPQSTAQLRRTTIGEDVLTLEREGTSIDYRRIRAPRPALAKSR